MNTELTREFVKRWNEKNGYDNSEESISSNMRYVRDGIVSWNQYDAEEVDIEEFASIFNDLVK